MSRSAAHFTSWLSRYFERFVAVKRATGADYHSQLLLLKAFDRYVCDRVPEAPLRREQLLDYLAGLERLCDRARDNTISVVWQALNYALLHKAEVEPLPPRPPAASRWQRRRPPRLVTPDELAAIMRATRQLPPVNGIRPATTKTLIGLLWTTGMRIGEALALDVGDLDPGERLLTIRRGKFGKTRVLPLHASTVEALDRYLQHPRRPVDRARSTPLFVSLRRRRLSYAAAAMGLRKTVLAAGIEAVGAPRPHDLRHTFAVRCVADAYANGRDVDKLLPALSTYLGHVSVEHTRDYLQVNGVLLEHAGRLFGDYAAGLDGGQP